MWTPFLCSDSHCALWVLQFLRSVCESCCWFRIWSWWINFICKKMSEVLSLLCTPVTGEWNSCVNTDLRVAWWHVGFSLFLDLNNTNSGFSSQLCTYWPVFLARWRVWEAHFWWRGDTCWTNIGLWTGQCHWLTFCVHVTLLYPFFPPCKMEILSNYLWSYE